MNYHDHDQFDQFAVCSFEHIWFSIRVGWLMRPFGCGNPRVFLRLTGNPGLLTGNLSLTKPTALGRVDGCLVAPERQEVTTSLVV